MGKFKVGDLVRVREWDDMVRQFGTNSEGHIMCSTWFTSGMSRFCGGVYKISKITRSSYNLEGGNGYFFSEDSLFPAIKYREYAEKVEPKRIESFHYGGVEGCPFSLSGMCQSRPDFCEAPNYSDEVCGKCWNRYITEREYEVYKKYVNDEVEKGEKKMKFRKGDYVRVVKATDGDGANWVSSMDHTIGKIYKINHVDGDHTCKLEGIDLFWFPFEALEPVSLKDILTPFCTVKTRNGNIYLFDGYSLLRERGHLDIDNHDEYLNARFSPDFDVIDICKPSGKNAKILDLLTIRGECIWKREEVVEITAEEAAKKLSEQYPGQTVKIVV